MTIQLTKCWSITGETILRDIWIFQMSWKGVQGVQSGGGGADACWMLGPECRSTMHALLVLLLYLYLACFVSFCLSILLSILLFFFFPLLFIGKWASSILGGLVYSLPSISTSLPISPFYTTTKEFFSKMAPNLDFRRSRPRITIDLANQKPNLVNSYTTGDRIDGTATISVDHDIRFDDIDITFEGIYYFSN